MLLVYALAGCRLNRFKKILIRIELIKQHATFDVVFNLLFIHEDSAEGK